MVRVRALDGLRGVAAVVVMIHHSLLVLPKFSAAYFPGEGSATSWWMTYTPLHALWAGPESVLVFFLLSGYVLSAMTSRTGFLWISYYPSRLVRLYLPVVLAALFAWFLWMGRDPFNHGASEWLVAHNGTESFAHVLSAAALVSDPMTLDSPLWSLRWEVFFSLALPVFVWGSRIVERVPLLVLAFAAAALAGIGSWMGVGALAYPPIFAIGVLLQRRNENQTLLGSAGRSATGRGVVLGLSMLLLTFSWVVAPLSSGKPATWLVGVTVLGAALLVAAVRRGFGRRLFDSRIARWLGKISFSLYLTHEPIVVFFASHLPESMRGWTIVIADPVALLVATAFAWAVEGPSHRFAQRIQRWIAVKRVGPSISEADSRLAA